MVSNGGEIRCYHSMMCIFSNMTGHHPIYLVYQETHEFEQEFEHNIEHKSKFKLIKGKRKNQFIQFSDSELTTAYHIHNFIQSCSVPI